MEIRTTNETWKRITIVSWVLFFIIILIVAGYFILDKVLENRREDAVEQVTKEIAMYQTNTGNILVWNGTGVVEYKLNFRENE
jgi:preprotein translocase subunit SecG